MTKEEKQLLLVDLCARLPYGVMCNDNHHGISRVTYIDITPDDIEQKNSKVVVYYFDFDECGELKNCKPYLRPMSSMTEEEIKDYQKCTEWEHRECYEVRANGEDRKTILEQDSYSSAMDLDWLNVHHFDYRGLIQRGLALPAPEGMYINDLKGDEK